ncbi:hypothetical protein BVER_02574 [Candidatus Burkholderia verschuerenii]|uniref:Uncharacterized protein n=2 Tax=Candidatus Burkholderia verschuerenii TaxID=242163 RepID=A0A0L0MC20_9BURK|nr:hypothetical protein BVER_02574 [Candidatus Burkholderia verschuerenii]
MTATDLDVLKVARDSGMTILLDARIGQVEYQSVSGTEESLQKFAHAVRDKPAPACRCVRAARSPSINPLVTARMRERIASVLYGKASVKRARSMLWHARRKNRRDPRIDIAESRADHPINWPRRV